MKKPLNYLLLISLAINVLGLAFWCPLHSIFPCGDNSRPGSGNPITVETTEEYDSAVYELAEVSEPLANTDNPDLGSQWLPYVAALETENEVLKKQHKADSLTNALLSSEMEQLWQWGSGHQHKADSLTAMISRLTKEDTAALVHKMLFERFKFSKTYRQEGVASVTIRGIIQQNRITESQAFFQDFSPTKRTTVNSYYTDRFKFGIGGSVAALMQNDFTSVTPFGGLALNGKFKSGTSLIPIYMIGPGSDNVQHMAILTVTQEIRIPFLRKWIDKRKAARAILKASKLKK